MRENLRIAQLQAAPGTKQQGWVQVQNTDVYLPVTLIHGIHPGRRILITAGIHGGEYVGIQSVIELSEYLKPELMSGSVILVHCCNPSSFKKITPEIVPEDGKNINRVFPGRMDGTLSEQIAYELTHTFQTNVDFYLDLHGGDLHEDLIPFVFYPGVAEPHITEASRQVAATLNMPYMLRSQATTGAYNSAAIRGIPSLLLERGGNGEWTRQEVEACKQDVMTALLQLEVYSSEIIKGSPKEVIHPEYLVSPLAGCWYPQVTAGSNLVKGQLLGEIRNFFGEVLQTYQAETDGCVLYLTTSLSVDQGTPLVAYAQVHEKEI